MSIESENAKSWGEALLRGADKHGQFIPFSEYALEDYTTETKELGVVTCDEISRDYLDCNYFVRVGGGWQGFRYLVNARNFANSE